MSGQLMIDGAWRHGAGSRMTSTNPATGAELWAGNGADATDVTAALDAAERAFAVWRQQTLEQRIAVVENFSQLVNDHRDALVEAISRETGKPLWDAAGEVNALAGKAQVSVSAYEIRTGVTERQLPAAKLRVQHRPHGVMAVLGPFNFPAHLPNGHIVPALIAGNTIVFKPSEQTPMVAEKMLQLWQEAGLPPGVINLVHGGADVGRQLVESDATRGVLFTGGVDAGLAIHRALAGKPDKICALELGGDCPLVVWDAADLSAVARLILRSAFITSGQRCTCARRLILPRGAEGDAVIESLQKLLERVIVDQPNATPAPFMSSLISAAAADQVLSDQQHWESHGGIVLRPCQRLELGAAFLSPGLIDVTDVNVPIDKEVFGPLLKVIRVDSFAQAIETANNSRFGLAAGLISDRQDLWDQFVSSINAGVVNWNRQTTGASGAAPFGGVGLSGNHRPAGFYSADYCAWPMASLLGEPTVEDSVEMSGVREE